MTRMIRGSYPFSLVFLFFVFLCGSAPAECRSYSNGWGPIPVSGTVLDDRTGKGVPNAWVVVNDTYAPRDPGGTVSEYTDANGNFSLTVNAYNTYPSWNSGPAVATIQICATSAGLNANLCLTSSISFTTVCPTLSQNILLHDPAPTPLPSPAPLTVSGKFTSAVTGAGLPGISVTLTDPVSGRKASGSTDPSGSYALSISSADNSKGSIGVTVCGAGTGYLTTCQTFYRSDNGIAQNIPFSFALGSVATGTTNTISCVHSGTGVGGSNTVDFSVSDCGGTLPGSSYTGVLSDNQVNGTNFGYAVLQPSAGWGAGVAFYQSFAGQASYEIGALFLKAFTTPGGSPSIISCVHSGTGYGGSNAFYFSGSECGGTLPDSTYTGVLSNNQVNGTSLGYAVFQPSAGASPGIGFYQIYNGAAGFQLGALYVKSFRLPDGRNSVIPCVHDGTGYGGSNTVTFTAADCGGAVPDANYTGVLSDNQVNGTSLGYAVLQPSVGSAPGVSFYQVFNGAAGYEIGVLYIHR